MLMHLVVILGMLWQGSSYAASRFQFSGQNSSVECDQEFSEILGRKVPYCVERSRPDLPKQQGEPVVFFFHGIAEDESGWVNDKYSSALAELRKSNPNLPPTTFVTFRTEFASFFSDYKGVSKGPHSYETWLLEEFIPSITRKLGLCDHRECRGAGGYSMGGFGALKIALKHPEIFSTVAVGSPALPPYNVFESMNVWMDYFGRHPVGKFRGYFLLTRVRNIFGNWTDSELNNPLALANSLSTREFPALYFSMGGKDYYGFEEGYSKFRDVLDSRGISYDTAFDPNGDHEVYQTPERARELLIFLTDHLSQSIKLD